MLKKKIFLNITSVLTCSVLMISCSDDNDTLNNDINNINGITSNSNLSSSSPFSFSNAFRNDDFQVDPDGNGAHNWDLDEYEDDPQDNGTDIRNFIFVSGNTLVLECPNGSDDDKRRAEFRDQVNLNLDDAHSMDVTFTIRDYDNDSELIMAQLHNDDSGVNRPYITIVAEDGEINLLRTNGPTGSSTERSSNTMEFSSNATYRLRIDTDSGDRSVFVRIINETANERIQETFEFNGSAEDAWERHNGQFYWKFGAYMPDGGSDNTQMRVEAISIQGQ